MDHYRTLGIDRQSTLVDIKIAYKKLAKKYHPDKNPGGISIFTDIVKAYEILSDPIKRQDYDYGTAFKRDYDRFNNFYKDNNKETKVAITKGEDALVKLNITIEDIYNKKEKTIKYTRNQTCGVCSGTGAKTIKKCKCLDGCTECNYSGTIVDEKCDKCKGKKLIESTKSTTIEITGTTRHNDIITIEAGGSGSFDGGPHGDLICYINVIDHELYEIDGDDLTTKIDLHPYELVLGVTKDITLFNKQYKIKIPNGCQPESLIALRGVGFDLGDSTSDVYFELNVLIPTIPSDSEIKLYESIKELYTILTNELE